MATITVRARQIDRVIVTPATRGRMVALHAHGPRRVRKKYAHAIVFLRSWLTRERLPGLLDTMRENGVTAVMSPKAWRRFCRALRKRGFEAHVERPRAVLDMKAD